MSMRGRQRKKAFDKQIKNDITVVHHWIMHGHHAEILGYIAVANSCTRYAGMKASCMAHCAFIMYPELRETEQ